ncbi:ATP-binding protein [Heliorestis acidaminivorans]|uniref:ATP-binding protein n=1 Tax=Heliorestis acidaminivorans TaxID=553427 RepID=A0A6I0ER35_9FIRM|nr:AAA family ATPase [Heliorestis acidaminivorans]KAB2951936.1 ATP-binding protein [Heliorestis acidaminivorans]
MLTIVRKSMDKDEALKAYNDNYEYIQDWIAYIEFTITFHLKHIVKIDQINEHKLDRFKGLLIGRDEMIRLLEGMNLESETSKKEQEKINFYDSCEMIENYLEERAVVTTKAGVFLPFAYMSHMLELSAFEKYVVMLSFLRHLDKKYEKIFGYLQDDVTRKSPTADLAIKLYLPGEAGLRVTVLIQRMEEKLFRYFFLENQESSHSLERELLLDQDLFYFILDIKGLRDSSNKRIKLFFPGVQVEPLLIQQQWQDQLVRVLQDSQGPLACFIQGPPGSGKKLHVKSAGNQLKRTVIFIETRNILNLDGTLNNRQLNQALREALLHDAILCLTDFEELLDLLANPDSTGLSTMDRLMTELLEELQGRVETLLILSTKPWSYSNRKSNFQWAVLEINLPNRIERKILWENIAYNLPLAEEIELYEVANKFNLTAGQIADACQEASRLTYWQGEEVISRQKLYQACYKQVSHKLNEKASLVFARYTMDDLILPEAQKKTLNQVCNHVKYRHVVLDEWGFDKKLPYGKGLSMLFCGPPGTGKTMAAQVIAHELGLEMYKIDLSQIVSKYIGETEKNLQEMFEEAKKSNAILFFDECDALFGKRTEVKDARDRYANLETSYLLQKIEEFEGVSILATNFINNIDDAFMRRIHYVLHFPFPDEKSREMIWRYVFPEKTPLSKQIDYAFLAKQFEFSGGRIKNIAVNSAFLAAAEGKEVSMSQLIRATKDELTKQGKVVVSSDFGEYGYLLRS